MKNYSIFVAIIALIAISAGFISCTKTEVINEETEVNINILAISQAFIFGAEGGTIDVPVESNINFSFNNPYNWITITKTGEKKDQVFHFTVSKNETAGKRNAEITYSNTEIDISISIEQSN